MGIRRKVTIRIISLCVLLTTSISLVTGFSFISDKRAHIGESLAQMAAINVDRLDRYMWSRYSEIKTFADIDPIAHTENRIQIRRTLESLQRSIPSFSWMGLTDINGTVVAATGGILENADISSRPVFQEGIKGEFAGDVHDAVLLSSLLPNPSGEPIKFVDLSFPVYGEDNNLKGVLASHLSWEWAYEIQEKEITPEMQRLGMTIYIISQKDNTIILGPKDSIGKSLNNKSIEKARSGRTGWIVEKWSDGSYLTGYSQSKGYEDYKGMGWTILVRQPLILAYKPLIPLMLFIALIGLIFTVLSAAIAWFYAKALSEPIISIAKSADALRFGEMRPVPVYKGVKELEMLSESINGLISSLSAAETNLDSMRSTALTDRLTGLPNRVSLESFLEQNIPVADRTGMRLEFLYIDLDGFKPVNDTYGHAAGDQVLKEVGRRLSSIVRKGEIAARIGGDEFVVVIFAENEQSAEKTAERIIDSLGEPYHVDDYQVTIGCSIGISHQCGESAECLADILEEADKALYLSKKSGKNRYTRV